MYRCHYGSYVNPNQNASAKWSATTDLDVYYSCSGNNITTRAGNYGNTGWAGNSYICTTGGCSSVYAFQFTYISCEAQSNTYFLSAYTDAKRQMVATHELGHCWSLNHNSRTTSVMQASTSATILNPDSGDISDVNNRY